MVCRILVADDSSTIQKVIRIGLAGVPCTIKSVASYVEACKVIDSEAFDLIIADAGLPGVSAGNDFLKLSERTNRAPLILLMGSYDTVREADLRAIGIENIIKKPFSPGELPNLVRKLIGGVAGDEIHSHPVNLSPVKTGISPVSISLAQESEAFNPSTPFKLESEGVLRDPFGAVDPKSDMPRIPEIEFGLRGRPAFDTPSANSMDLKKSFSQSDSLKALTNLTMATANFNDINTNAGLSDSIESFIKSELPALVEQAVERYCAEHFKGVAREALISELRRLADEKARYLVDQ